MSGKRRWLLFGGVSLSIFLLLYLFLVRPAQKRLSSIRSEVSNKTAVLRSFLASPNGPPSREEIKLLANETKILEDRYRDIKNIFINETNMMRNITPVEFGKILHERKRELVQESENAGIEIPPALGFKETIPRDDEVEIMAKELEAITFIIEEGIAFKCGDIKMINYLGLKKEEPWEKIGMEIEFYGELKNIVDFLYSLSQREKIYIIRSLGITRRTKEVLPSSPTSKAAALEPEFLDPARLPFPPELMGIPEQDLKKMKQMYPELSAQIMERGRKKPLPPVPEEEKEADKPIILDRVSAAVQLEFYSYIAAHGD